MKTTYFFFIIGTSILVSCNQTDSSKKDDTKAENSPLPSPEIIYTINVDNSQDQIDLKLTDLADSFRLIPLETKSQCLLDRGTEFFVTEKFILAYSQDGAISFLKMDTL